MNKKIISLLSISQNAGLLITGEETCEKALQANKAKLVIVATDASDNTKKKFKNKSFYYKVECFQYSTKDELSNAIGKKNRATLIITDDNLAKKVKGLLEEEGLKSLK